MPGGRVPAAPGVLLLDEPTNNLDLAARQRLYEAVGSWKGAMVIVSHDRELLGLVDQIGELRSGQIRWYGGNLSDYERAVAVEQEAAERAVRSADADVQRQQRELIEARIKLDRRLRYAQKMQDTNRVPKILANERKRQAQVSAGKLRTGHVDRLDEAKERLAAAEEAVRDDDEIRVDLPATQVPSGRGVLALHGVEVRYGARAGPAGPRPGTDRADRPERGGQDDTVAHDRGAHPGGVRRGEGQRPGPVPAAAAGHPGPWADRRGERRQGGPGRDAEPDQSPARPVPVPRAEGRPARRTLSGGELSGRPWPACCWPQPAPQLLMLDEPTNNLDMASARQLLRGAAVVPWHIVRGDPRRGVPPRHRPHPLVAPGRGSGDRSALVVAHPGVNGPGNGCSCGTLVPR